MKKTLKWRLSELPTGDEVASLVEQKVITTDEARQILFNEEKEDGNKVAALKEEVKFLRELCDTLAAKSNGWTTIIREYERYKPSYPVWYQGYSGIINAGSITTTASSNTLNNAVYSVSSSANIGKTKMLGSLNN